MAPARARWTARSSLHSSMTGVRHRRHSSHEAALAKQDDFDQLQQLARDSKVISCGEMARSFYRPLPRDVQQRVFFSRWRWPVPPSCRSSSTAARRTTARMPGTTPCASSARTGPAADSEESCTASLARSNTRAPRWIWDLSFHCRQHHLSQGPEHSRRSGDGSLDRMFIETDCPYLAPVPHRGKRNEPAYVVETARLIAELRGLSAEEVGRQTRKLCPVFPAYEAQLRCYASPPLSPRRALTMP